MTSIKSAKFIRRGGRGFTIIELLTVMSIIIILMSVLVPALSRVRRYAKTVTQKAQFHEISKGLELFRNDHQDIYPDSGAVDSNGDGYCGAMRMCEALLGQDGMGFHPSSNFQAKQTSTYLFDLCTETSSADIEADSALMANLRERIKYVDSEHIRTYRLQDVYNWVITSFSNNCALTGTFKNTIPGYPNAIIGDVFQRATINSTYCSDRAGEKVGMPVLYYKADPSKLSHDAVTTPPDCPTPNIYNYDDNYAITALGCPWEGGAAKTTDHPMFTDPLVFLNAITNTKITSTPRPHNEDGYILMSAGYDGLYGTRDDVYNFAD